MNKSAQAVAVLAAGLILSGCSPVPASQTTPTATPNVSAPSAGPQNEATASPSASRTSGAPTMTTPARTVTPTSTPTRTADGTSDLAAATLSPAGLGPARIGTSLADARARGWAGQNPNCSNEWDANADLRAKGIQFQFGGDRLNWILIHSSSPVTSSQGAKLGMSRDQVGGLYGTTLRTEVRESSGGDVTFPLVQEGGHEIVFMFDDSGVLRSMLAQDAGAPVVSGC